MGSYSENFERDWEFYVETRDIFTFSGQNLYHWDVEYDQHGVSAKEAFHKYDSTGEIEPTREPVLLAEVFRAKASVNFHIKMWAKGFAEGTLIPIEFKDYLDDLNAPDWVYEAVKKQAEKLIEKGEVGHLLLN